MQTPEPGRVKAIGFESRVFHGKRRGAHREPDRAAHQLRTLFLVAQIRRYVEILDLARDLDRQARGVKALDEADTGTPFHNRLAKGATTDPVG